MTQADVEMLRLLHSMSRLSNPEPVNRKERRAAASRKRKQGKKNFAQSNLSRK